MTVHVCTKFNKPKYFPCILNKINTKMSVKNEDGQYPYLMIGEELRYLLKASGVSLKMIADHAGMSNTTIQTLLKGGM